MGHRGQITADIVFDDVLVPHRNVLGHAGGGLSVALSALVRGRIGIGAAGVGVARAALDLAVERLRTRHVFGAPLGAMQHWQFTMAQRATEIECARSLYQKAATQLDRGDRSAEPEAAMAKAYGTRLANDLIREAIQIHGALGFARQVGEPTKPASRSGSKKCTATQRFSRSSKAPTNSNNGSWPVSSSAAMSRVDGTTGWSACQNPSHGDALPTDPSAGAQRRLSAFRFACFRYIR